MKQNMKDSLIMALVESDSQRPYYFISAVSIKICSKIRKRKQLLRWEEEVDENDAHRLKSDNLKIFQGFGYLTTLYKRQP